MVKPWITHEFYPWIGYISPVHREAGEAEEAELIVVGIATVFTGCGGSRNCRLWGLTTDSETTEMWTWQF